MKYIAPFFLSIENAQSRSLRAQKGINDSIQDVRNIGDQINAHCELIQENLEGLGDLSEIPSAISGIDPLPALASILTQLQTNRTSIDTITTTLIAHPPLAFSPYVGSCTKLTPVNVATTSVVIAPANPNRRGFIVFNNSANSGYISFAATSVASECTRLIATFTSWEMLTPIAYTGALSAIRNSGTGAMTVYEFT